MKRRKRTKIAIGLYENGRERKEIEDFINMNYEVKKKKDVK
jgi:hypothetical protein